MRLRYTIPFTSWIGLTVLCLTIALLQTSCAEEQQQGMEGDNYENSGEEDAAQFENNEQLANNRKTLLWHKWN